MDVYRGTLFLRVMEEQQLTMPSKIVSDVTSSSEFQEVIIPEPLRQMKLEASDMSSQCGENAASYSTSPSEKSEADAGDDVLPPHKRPIECQYHLKGRCAFGASCIFNHSSSTPKCSKSMEFNFLGLPIRQGEDDCVHYMSKGSCRYGFTCRFNHPHPKVIEASSIDSLSVLAVKNAGLEENIGAVDRSYLFEGQHDSTYSTVTSATQLKGMDADSTSNLLPTFKLYDAAAKNRILPERPGHLDCPYYLKHGTCGYAENCRFNHPKQVNSTASLPVVKEQDGQPRAPFRTEQSAAMVQSDFNLPNIQISNLAIDNASSKKDSFPERQGQPDCQFFLKTGGCAFGEECIFNHPKVTKKQTSPCLLNENGLPLRPGKTVCKFYSQHGSCRFGLNCLFDHPEAK